MTTYNASTMPNIVNRFPNSLRAMPIKVVYTLNDNIQQFFLARHTPIAVRLVRKAEPSRRQRQKAAKQLRKGGSASFSTPTRITPTRRSQTGAESKGEVINVDDVTEEPAEDEPEEVEYGFAPLKVCIKAVWAASPDLAYDRSREWSVYCLDPMEQSGSKPMANDSVASKFSGVMTGMGLVSHALQEDDRTLSPVSVTGRIIDDQGGEALEVILQMKSTMTPGAMAHPYAAWPQHQMMYGYPQHPSFYRAATASMLAAQQRAPPLPVFTRSKSTAVSASTPASSDAPTPELSAGTSQGEPSQEANGTARSSSVEPSRKVLTKPFTQQPLVRAPPPKAKVPSKPTPATPADIFLSLATRLNSVDGGSEPPAPDTEEGQLLDCMVAWLKTAAGARIAAEIGMGAPTPAASSAGTDGSTPAEAIEVPASPPSAEASSSQTSNSSSQHVNSHRLSSSQPKPQPAVSTTAPSQTKSGRVILGNKSNAMPKQNKVPNGGKPVGKSMTRSLSGPNGTKKRVIDDEEYGPSKKRQKTTRSVSGTFTASISQPQPQTNTPKPGTTVETAKGKGLFDFPKSSDILGIKFAPKRAYSANLDGNSTEEFVVTKKQPGLETPRPRRNVDGAHRGLASFDPTSPFVGIQDGGAADDSLFSEAGTPAIQRNFSTYKIGKSGGEERMTDGMRPSSPCERRATIGGSIVRMPPQSPIYMLGQGASKTLSPPSTRTPQPRWAVDLPPSSPPPPSSPVATDYTSTPVDPGEDEHELKQHEETGQPQVPENVPSVNESPSKFFARYFDFEDQSEGDDLAAALLSETATEPGTGTVTPSELGSEACYGSGFDFNLGELHLENNPGGSNLDFGSSSSFTLEGFGWSDGTVGTSQGDSSDGEFEAGGASSDLDFDVGELWSWMQRSDARSNATGQDTTVGLPSSTSQPGQVPNNSMSEEGDPLRVLLGGCVV